jgi:hypothetical protein
MQQRGNHWRRLLLISREQRMCPANPAGWSIALLDEGIKQPAFILAQLHNIFLGHGTLFWEGVYPRQPTKEITVTDH